MYLKMLNIMADIAGAKTLPAEYQEVEYLEATGTQYILTDIVAPTTPYFNLYIDYISYGTSDNIIFGQYPNFYIDLWGSRFYASMFTSLVDRQGVLRVGVRSTLEVISDETKTLYYYNNGFVAESAVNNLLFNGTIFGTSYRQRTRIYKLLVTTEKLNKYNFIPCYRKSDSVAGMYDVEHQRFYTNSGTGTFIVGPNI